MKRTHLSILSWILIAASLPALAADLSDGVKPDGVAFDPAKLLESVRGRYGEY